MSTLIQKISEVFTAIGNDIKQIKEKINYLVNPIEEKTYSVPASINGEITIKEIAIANNFILLHFWSKEKEHFIFDTANINSIKTTEGNKDIYTLSFTRGDSVGTNLLTNLPKTDTYFNLFSNADPVNNIGVLKLSTTGSISFIFVAGTSIESLGEGLKFTEPLVYVKA